MYYNKKYLFANGVLIITLIVSTLEHVDDDSRQEEEHMTTSKTTLLASTTEVGKIHSCVVFINKTLIIIITKNIDLKSISYCS